jgi:hypothetical protein
MVVSTEIPEVSRGFDRHSGSRDKESSGDGPASLVGGPGRRTLTEQLTEVSGAVVQRQASAGAPSPSDPPVQRKG